MSLRAPAYRTRLCVPVVAAICTLSAHANDAPTRAADTTAAPATAAKAAPKPAPAPAQARAPARAASESARTSLAKHVPMQAQRYYEGVWGVDSLTVKYTESGEMIRFSYRVLDAGKAAALNAKDA